MSSVLNLDRAHAILRVRYRGNKNDVQRHEVESEKSMLDKIKELQSNPEVVQVGVFLCHHYSNKREIWDDTPYSEAKTPEAPQ